MRSHLLIVGLIAVVVLASRPATAVTATSGWGEGWARSAKRHGGLATRCAKVACDAGSLGSSPRRAAGPARLVEEDACGSSSPSAAMP